MPEPKRPLKVFLCHASADKPAVRSLYKRLVADGVDVWLDAESLVAGQNWQFEIPKAIRESDVVIVCLSEKSINKEGYVQREIKFALDVADEKPEGTIYIVPVKLEECKVPDRLSMYHWVDLFEKNGYERLLRALRLRADKIDATLQIKKKWSPIVQTQPAIFKKSLTFRQKQENAEQRSVGNASPSKQKLKPRKIIGVLVQGLLAIMVVTGLILTFWNPIIPKPSFLGSTQVDTTPSFAAKPSETHSVIQTKIDTVVPTSLSTEITDDKGVSMVLVPAGEFTMGNETGQEVVRQVFLVDFYMDIYEVTNAAYELCVDAGGCSVPQTTNSYTRPSYYGNSKYDNYPVVYVDWTQAKNYCEWRGANLPTEAQWEKAARGTDGRTYPWGEILDCRYANYSGCGSMDTMAVGIFDEGKSPFGIYDMAGNVFEIVDDWYSGTESYRIVRGGSWDSGSGSWIVENVNYVINTDTLKTFSRDIFRTNIMGGSNNVGFRCAKGITP